MRATTLILGILALLCGCHAFRDEPAVPLKGRLVLEVIPNPLVARPLGHDWYELQFDIVMREEGGVGVRIEDFTVEAVAFRTVTVSTQTFPASYITDRGYPAAVDAGKHLRFSFTRRWQLPTPLLLSGASARVRARTMDANGIRNESTVRVGVTVGDVIAPEALRETRGMK
ncbi:MAG: hypothetical protein ACXW2P_03245 [Thermoanaerobaculia bacterium]